VRHPLRVDLPLRSTAHFSTNRKKPGNPGGLLCFN
jgi:hypothetical protein